MLRLTAWMIVVCFLASSMQSQAYALAPPSAEARLGRVAGHLRNDGPADVQAALTSAGESDTTGLTPLSQKQLARLNDLHEDAFETLVAELKGFGFTTLPAREKLPVHKLNSRDLEFPDGVNIALFPDGSSGRAMAFMAGNKAGKANFICPLPVKGNYIIQRGKPSRLFCRFALIRDAQGKWDWGYFEKPLPIHAFWNSSRDSTAEKARIPVLNEKSVMTICEDKSNSKKMFRDAKVRTPAWMHIDEPNPRHNEMFASLSLAVVASGRPNLKGYVVKGIGGSGGERVRLFDKNEENEEKELIEHALFLLNHGMEIIIEERLESMPLFNPKGVRMDWNIRVLMTRNAAGKACMADLEIRLAPYADGLPVNVHQGAEVIEWGTLADWMGWDAVERKKRLGKVKRFAIAMANACDEGAKKISRNPRMQSGFQGLDMIWSEDGLLYAIESNSRNVGGLGSLAKLREGDAKLKALIPILRHLTDKATAYKGLLDLSPDENTSPVKIIQPSANDLDALAYLLMRQKKYDTALDFSLQARARDPYNVAVRETIAQIYYNARNYKEAAEAYRILVKVEPTLGRYLDSLADCYQCLDRWGELKLTAQKLIVAEPHLPLGYIRDGIAEYNMGNLELAQQGILKGLAMLPDRMKVPGEKAHFSADMGWRWLAQIALDQKRYEDAHAYIQKVLAADPDFWGYTMPLARFYEEGNKQWDKAGAIYRKEVEKDPHYRYAWLKLARSYFEQDDAAAALTALQEEIGKNERHSSLAMAKAVAEMLAGSEEKAIEEVKKLCTPFRYRRPERVHWFYVNAVWGITVMGIEAKAKELLEKLLQNDPHYVNAWYMLARLYKNDKEYGRAYEAAIRMTKLFPKDARGWYLAAHCSMEGKITAKPSLKALIRKGFSLDPKMRCVLDENIRANCALALGLDGGKPNEAIRILRRILNSRKGHTDLKYARMKVQLALCYERKKEIKTALKYVEEALIQLPEEALALLMAGRYHYLLGEDKIACDFYARGFSRKPPEMTSRTFVGEYADAVVGLQDPDLLQKAERALSQVGPEFVNALRSRPAFAHTTDGEISMERSL